MLCLPAFILHEQGRKHGKLLLMISERKRVCVCVCLCVCVCVHVYVVYEDTNLYNDMGMT